MRGVQGTDGCFPKLGILFVGVVVIGTLLGPCKAADFLKLLYQRHLEASGWDLSLVWPRRDDRIWLSSELWLLRQMSEQRAHGRPGYSKAL